MGRLPKGWWLYPTRFHSFSIRCALECNKVCTIGMRLVDLQPKLCTFGWCSQHDLFTERPQIPHFCMHLIIIRSCCCHIWKIFGYWQDVVLFCRCCWLQNKEHSNRPQLQMTLHLMLILLDVCKKRLQHNSIFTMERGLQGAICPIMQVLLKQLIVHACMTWAACNPSQQHFCTHTWVQGRWWFSPLCSMMIITLQKHSYVDHWYFRCGTCGRMVTLNGMIWVGLISTMACNMRPLRKVSRRDHSLCGRLWINGRQHNLHQCEYLFRSCMAH